MHECTDPFIVLCTTTSTVLEPSTSSVLTPLEGTRVTLEEAALLSDSRLDSVCVCLLRYSTDTSVQLRQHVFPLKRAHLSELHGAQVLE